MRFTRSIGLEDADGCGLGERAAPHFEDVVVAGHVIGDLDDVHNHARHVAVVGRVRGLDA